MRKLLLGLAVLGLSCTMGAAHAATAASRPLRSSGSGTVTVVPPAFGGTFHGTTSGKGTFSGSFVIGSIPPPCPASVPVTDAITLTAANGDIINEDVNGTVCESSPNNFHETATYTVTGGTGRYLSATGTGSFISDAYFPNGLTNPGAFSFSQNGTITY